MIVNKCLLSGYRTSGINIINAKHTNLAASNCTEISSATSAAMRNNRIGEISFRSNMRYDEDDVIQTVVYIDDYSAKVSFDNNFQTLKRRFKTCPGELTGRIKDESSAIAKLKQGVGNYRKALNMMEDEEQRTQALVSICCDLLEDAYGYRYVLKTGSPQESTAFTDSLAKAIENEELKLIKFANHGEKPYLNEEQCANLELLGGKYGKPKKESGYTGARFLFKTRWGNTIELQLMGPQTQKVSDKEHPIYKYFKFGHLEKETKKMKKALENITPTQKLWLDEYRQNCYRYARNQELGIQGEKPSLPQGLKKVFKIL